jgi:hypothetical protein
MRVTFRHVRLLGFGGTDAYDVKRDGERVGAVQKHGKGYFWYARNLGDELRNTSGEPPLSLEEAKPAARAWVKSGGGVL